MTTGYELCIYDGSQELIARFAAPAAELCNANNPQPCWKETTRGFRYSDKDLTPHGVQRILLKEGLVPGSARIVVKGKDANLGLPTIPLLQPVTIQLKNSDGICWESVYSAPPSRNDLGPPAQFKDRAD